MCDTNVLWDDTRRACGTKRLAGAIGRDENTVYRWGTVGERNIFDWIEAIVQVLVLRPEGRAILVRLHHWFNQLFSRALDAVQPNATSVSELRSFTVRALRETADVVEKCSGEQIDRDELVREALEARDVLDQLISAAGRGEVPQQRSLRARR